MIVDHIQLFDSWPWLQLIDCGVFSGISSVVKQILVTYILQATGGPGIGGLL